MEGPIAFITRSTADAALSISADAPQQAMHAACHTSTMLCVPVTPHVAPWCRYNLLREDSEGWAKVMDVLNLPMEAEPSAAAINQTVRPCACLHAVSEDLREFESRLPTRVWRGLRHQRWDKLSNHVKRLSAG